MRAVPSGSHLKIAHVVKGLKALIRGNCHKFTSDISQQLAGCMGADYVYIYLINTSSSNKNVTEANSVTSRWRH